MPTTIEYDKMTASLQTEFFSVYDKVREAKECGDDKKYKSWVDALWKISRVLIDLKNLQRNLGLSSEQEDKDDSEYAKLLERLEAEEKLTHEAKKALLTFKNTATQKMRITQ